MRITGTQEDGICELTLHMWLQSRYHFRVSNSLFFKCPDNIANMGTGFVGTLGANVSEAASNLGHLGWCLSFTLGFTVYWAINQVWPHENVKNTKHLAREELAKESFIEGIEQEEETKEARISLSAKV